jgi:hypothetical protein
MNAGQTFNPTCHASPRLDALETEALKNTLKAAGVERAWLFGSRTDPKLRGGAIHVLALSSEIDLLAKLDIFGKPSAAAWRTAHRSDHPGRRFAPLRPSFCRRGHTATGTARI